MSKPTPSSEAPRLFPRTRWSLVLAAAQKGSAESTAALETICSSYWQPLYAYVRRCGQSEHDAEDLTQEFFNHLLEKRWLDSANPEKGKLRTFLIVMLKRFMANEWRRASTQRRGSGLAHVRFSTDFAESHSAVDQGRSLAPDELFDRQWAMTLLNRTIERLQAEFASAGKLADFAKLKDCLMAARGTIDYSALAKQLAVNEGAARVAAHRLRKRFREIYREEISQTVSDDANLESELRYLAGVLARE